MKKIFSILFLSAVASLLHGQNVNFEWAKQMGGTDLVDARGLSIATDALGNVYTTGLFEGKVDFDPGSGVYDLEPLDSVDLYISKLDLSGKFLMGQANGREPEFNWLKGKGDNHRCSWLHLYYR